MGPTYPADPVVREDLCKKLGKVTLEFGDEESPSVVQQVFSKSSSVGAGAAVGGECVSEAWLFQPSPPLVRPCAQPGAWLCPWLAGRLRTWLCFLECLSYREESSVIEYIIFIRNKHGLLIGKFIRFFKDERGDVKETLGGTAGLRPVIWFHCS